MKKTAVGQHHATTYNTNISRTVRHAAHLVQPTILFNHRIVVEQQDVGSTRGLDPLVARTSEPEVAVILDEADAMTQDAQNALRRIIEKFTDNVRFCLICNYLSKIIPALQSRCTRFRFGPLDPAQIMPRLQHVCDEEGVNVTEDGKEALIQLSQVNSCPQPVCHNLGRPQKITVNILCF